MTFGTVSQTGSLNLDKPYCEFCPKGQRSRLHMAIEIDGVGCAI